MMIRVVYMYVYIYIYNWYTYVTMYVYIYIYMYIFIHVESWCHLFSYFRDRWLHHGPIISRPVALGLLEALAQTRNVNGNTIIPIGLSLSHPSDGCSVISHPAIGGPTKNRKPQNFDTQKKNMNQYQIAHAFAHGRSRIQKPDGKALRSLVRISHHISISI